MRIYKTTDYNQFKTLKGNRGINQNHVKTLVSSIEKENLLEANPIIINSRFQVIDGQHRLEAAKVKNLPVYYVMSKGSIDTVLNLNNSSKRWGLTDYVETHILEGKDQFQYLKDFAENWEIPLSTAAGILEDRHSGGGTSRRIKDGVFKIVDKDLANKVMTWVHTCKPFVKDRFILSHRHFISAIRELVVSETIDLDGFRHKLNLRDREIVRSTNKVDYLRQVEEIINWKNKTKIRLF